MVKMRSKTASMNMQLIIIIIQCLSQDVLSQQIHLFPYKETKNCNMSLVEEMDRILMYGKVDFNGNITASSNVNFKIKRKTDTSFQYFTFLKVPDDCDKDDLGDITCTTIDANSVFELTLTILAYKGNSEAEVQAQLVNKETSFLSEKRKLPIVFGSQTQAVVLYANDRVIQNSQSAVTINGTQVTIFSMCLQRFVQHCELQLTNLETKTLLKSGEQVIVYVTKIKDKESFILKYSICNIQRNIKFSITTENKEFAIILKLTSFEKSFLLIFILATMISCYFVILLSRRTICKIEKIQALNCIESSASFHTTFDSEELIPLTKESDVDENHAFNAKSRSKRDTKDYHHKKRTVDNTTVPIRYRNNDFERLLEILSQLSCQITLKKKSFSNRRNHLERLGCGLVTNIFIYSCGVGINTVKTTLHRVCPCTECVKSKSPSNTWAEIFITTSSDIIQINNYHKHFVCVLSTEDNVTTELRDLTVKHKDSKKSGLCVLKYVTCDQSLIHKLQTLQETLFKLQTKVQETFHQDKSHDKIYFAIVYRDGQKDTCTGSWSQEKNKDNVRTYRYDPEIPIGNIGAPVVLMGYSNIEYEYNQIRNSLGEVSANNLSTAVFTIEYAQKVKRQ